MSMVVVSNYQGGNQKRKKLVKSRRNAANLDMKERKMFARQTFLKNVWKNVGVCLIIMN
jgi:hypothetical protein